MITTRTEKLEQLLTEDCRKALAEIDVVIQEKSITDFNFEFGYSFAVHLETCLNHREDHLIKEVLKLAGWKDIRIRGNHVHFYF